MQLCRLQVNHLAQNDNALHAMNIHVLRPFQKCGITTPRVITYTARLRESIWPGGPLLSGISYLALTCNVPRFRIVGDFPPFRVLGYGLLITGDFPRFRVLGFGVIFRRSVIPPFHVLGSPRFEFLYGGQQLPFQLK